MSKTIPVFAFAFLAYAWSSYPVGGTSRPAPRPGSRNPSGSPANNIEGERFDEAWRLAPYDRRDFTVCVRALRLAKSPGYRLLDGAGAHPNNFDHVWLDDIEQIENGFVGRVREPTERLDDVLSQRRICFSLENVAHWTFAPTASPCVDLTCSPRDEFVASARGAH